MKIKLLFLFFVFNNLLFSQKSNIDSLLYQKYFQNDIGIVGKVYSFWENTGIVTHQKLEFGIILKPDHRVDSNILGFIKATIDSAFLMASEIGEYKGLTKRPRFSSSDDSLFTYIEEKVNLQKNKDHYWAVQLLDLHVNIPDSTVIITSDFTKLYFYPKISGITNNGNNPPDIPETKFAFTVSIRKSQKKYSERNTHKIMIFGGTAIVFGALFYGFNSFTNPPRKIPTIPELPKSQ